MVDCFVGMCLNVVIDRLMNMGNGYSLDTVHYFLPRNLKLPMLPLLGNLFSGSLTCSVMEVR